MAFINIKFMSEVLGRNTEIAVMIPQHSTNGQIGVVNGKSSGKFKTLVLLHGLSDDFSIWARRTNIERYATEHGIAVILPSGDRSFYTDMKHGDKFYTYISQEVLDIAREFLPLSDRKEDTFIAGNSMGGYGALKIALKNPDRFCAAMGLSSVSDIINHMDNITPELKDNIFGETISDEEDLFYLLKKAKKETAPRIFMCVGKGDFLYEENVRLSKAFFSTDLDYTYIEDEGVHDWDFWDKYIRIALKWALKK